MIVLRVQGGVGNQLFQLAKAFSVSEKSGETVIGHFSCGSGTRREFLTKQFANSLGFRFGLLATCLYFLLKLVDKFGGLRKKVEMQNGDFITHRFFGFTLIEGYWISQNVPDAFVKKLQLYRDGRVGVHGEFRYGECAIHIRGGDYLAEDNANYRVLGELYVRSALNAAEVSREAITVFTDDLDNARSLLCSLDTTISLFDSDNCSDDFEVLLIMSLFKKIIIWNSTFSYWAALIRSQNSKAVAPAIWSFDGSIDVPPLNDFEKLICPPTI